MEDQGIEFVGPDAEEVEERLRDLEKKSVSFICFLSIILFSIILASTALVVDFGNKIIDLEARVSRMDSVSTFNSLALLDKTHILKQDYQGLSEWQALKLAIVEVESTNNPMAHNMKSNALGCMQITPIYVKHINERLGFKKFKHRDALAIDKSFEMFDIMNQLENPYLDIDKAISIHHPNGGDVYKRKVYRKMKEIIQRDLIYFHLLNN